jgi:ribosomal protein L24
MSRVKITAGKDKGKFAKVLVNDSKEPTIIVDGEEKAKKIKIDWIKVLTWAERIIAFIKSIIK